MVKILDDIAVNGRFWVFYGGLSDMEYTITVTETAEQAVYHKPAGEICGRRRDRILGGSHTHCRDTRSLTS